MGRFTKGIIFVVFFLCFSSLLLADDDFYVHVVTETGATVIAKVIFTKNGGAAILAHGEESRKILGGAKIPLNSVYARNLMLLKKESWRNAGFDFDRRVQSDPHQSLGYVGRVSVQARNIQGRFVVEDVSAYFQSTEFRSSTPQDRTSKPRAIFSETKLTKLSLNQPLSPLTIPDAFSQQRVGLLFENRATGERKYVAVKVVQQGMISAVILDRFTAIFVPTSGLRIARSDAEYVDWEKNAEGSPWLRQLATERIYYTPDREVTGRSDSEYSVFFQLPKEQFEFGSKEWVESLRQRIKANNYSSASNPIPPAFPIKQWFANILPPGEAAYVKGGAITHQNTFNTRQRLTGWVGSAAGLSAWLGYQVFLGMPTSPEDLKVRIAGAAAGVATGLGIRELMKREDTTRWAYIDNASYDIPNKVPVIRGVGIGAVGAGAGVACYHALRWFAGF